MRALDESVSLLRNANLLARVVIALANYKIGERMMRNEYKIL